MKKFPRTLAYVLAFLVIFSLGWGSSAYYFSQKVASGQNSSQNTNVLSPLLGGGNTNRSDLKMFWNVWDLLSQQYVDESALNDQQQVYGAIKGMVAAVNDPYTVYMTPDETKEFDQSLSGELEGIGAELTVRDKALVVVSPLKNSPAEKAGLLPEDIVYKIDGKVTAEMSLFDAIMHIRGEKGTKVTLTIIRKGIDEPFDLSIVRETVNVESVSMEDKGNNIYYLSINQFGENTAPEFEAKVNELLLKQPKGLILDLRNNGGGLLDTAVNVLSEFIVGKKPAVGIKQRDAKKDTQLFVDGNAHLGTVPLVVLINKGSASASEIVAGAIQDYKRGILMGEQSFGKGSVQDVHPLSDGSSLRITIAKWYTPNGQNIDHVGIKPDMEIKMSDDDYEKKKDTQLNAAMEYLKNLKN